MEKDIDGIKERITAIELELNNSKTVVAKGACDIEEIANIVYHRIKEMEKSIS